MDTDGYTLLAAGLGIGLLLGFIIGQMNLKSNQKKKFAQKLLPDELERWRLQPKYQSLLMEKKPELKAKELLKKLNTYVKENNTEIEAIDQKVTQFTEELMVLRDKSKNAKSKVEKALIMETQFSTWLAKAVAVRVESQNCNDAAISLGYQSRFLKFVSKGEVKPGIVGLMDSSAIVQETQNSTKKNFSFMAEAMKSMDDGNYAEHAQAFGVD